MVVLSSKARQDLFKDQVQIRIDNHIVYKQMDAMEDLERLQNGHTLQACNQVNNNNLLHQPATLADSITTRLAK